MKRWAILDENGEPIRFVDTPIDGAVNWPPLPKQLNPDDPEWFNIPF